MWSRSMISCRNVARGVGNLAGDLGALLDQPGEGVRALDRHAALLFQ
jgi:hypothetical protein